MKLQRMRLFLHTVFCLKDISEASAKKPKTLSEYQVTIGMAFSVFSAFRTFYVFCSYTVVPVLQAVCCFAHIFINFSHL